jgi:hypothetical protein
LFRSVSLTPFCEMVEKDRTGSGLSGMGEGLRRYLRPIDS